MKTKIFDYVTQMKFDVAILKGTTIEERDEMMERIERIINKNTRFVVIGCGRDSIEYDMNEVEKNFGNDRLSNEEHKKLEPIYEKIRKEFEEPGGYEVFEININDVDDDSIHLGVVHGFEDDQESRKETVEIEIDRKRFKVYQYD